MSFPPVERIISPQVVSFIIPAFNEELLLGSTLAAVHSAAQALGEPYEVIVADDGSRDRTVSIAEAGRARVVSAAHRQIAATRNSGARLAKGGMFVFVDADTLVNPAVIRAAVKAMRDGAVGGGSAVLFDGRLPAYAKMLAPMSVWCFRVTRLAAGCFLFCTRAGFEAVNGFDEGLYCSEEIYMSAALKRQGRFVVLRESVLTSGRKLRHYPFWELLRIFGGMALRGPKSARSRDGKELWYEDRRRGEE